MWRTAAVKKSRSVHDPQLVETSGASSPFGIFEHYKQHARTDIGRTDDPVHTTPRRRLSQNSCGRQTATELPTWCDDIHHKQTTQPKQALRKNKQSNPKICNRNQKRHEPKSYLSIRVVGVVGGNLGEPVLAALLRPREVEYGNEEERVAVGQNCVSHVISSHVACGSKTGQVWAMSWVTEVA